MKILVVLTAAVKQYVQILVFQLLSRQVNGIWQWNLSHFMEYFMRVFLPDGLQVFFGISLEHLEQFLNQGLKILRSVSRVEGQSVDPLVFYLIDLQCQNQSRGCQLGFAHFHVEFVFQQGSFQDVASVRQH